MATTEENIKQIVFNRLSKAKYEELKANGQLNANEFYITPDESVTQDDFADALANKLDVSTYDTDKAEIDAEIAKKANTSDVNEALAKKLDVETYNTDKATFALQSDVDDALDLKADKSDTYTKSEVDAKLSSVYKFKGSVENFAALPSENNVEGDVYNCLDTGDNYAWVAATETEKGFWDKLAGNIDLSGYMTAESVQAALDKKLDVETYNTDKATFALQSDVNDALDLKADKSDTYTKSDVDTALGKKLDVETYNTDKATFAVASEVEEELDKKANASDVYTKSETYTQDEVDELLENKAVAVVRTWED